MTAHWPDGCEIIPDRHCTCWQSEIACCKEDPCCLHDPELHDGEDDE